MVSPDYCIDLYGRIRKQRVRHNLSCFFSLFQGDIGPFSPSLPIDIPLWMAINLKQRQKARIRPPDWMEVGRILFATLTRDDNPFTFTIKPV